MKSISLTVGALVLALALVVAGCGSTKKPSSSGTNSTADRTSATLKFTACMREHGIDLPDPGPDGRIRITGGSGIDTSSPAFAQAQKACGKNLAGTAGSFSHEDRSALEAAALKFARCMRLHGVDMPDPKTNGGMLVFGGADPGDPATQRALIACQRLLPPPPAPAP